MNDSPLAPSGRSQPNKTPLSPEFAKRMKAIQEREKDSSPETIAALPAEEGLDENHGSVVAKFVARARDPETGLPQYAIVDGEVATAMRIDGDLDTRWRLHATNGGKYVIIDRKKAGRFVTLKDLYRIATGRSIEANQTVIMRDGNLADVRGCNLTTVPFKRGKRLQVPPLRWDKTPLANETHVRMIARQEALEGAPVTAIRWQSFIDGKLLDGTEIALKLATSPYPHADSGHWRYQITDRTVGDWFKQRQNPLDPWGWSLSFFDDGVTPRCLIISRCASQQLVRVVFGILHPKEPLSSRRAISTKNGNPLDMRRENLHAKENPHSGTQR